MMSELKEVKQQPGGLKRRWFSDDYFDLIVWESNRGDIVKFELCYCKIKDEHAFVWSQEKGHSHLKVDDGEGGMRGQHKMSPVFVADGYFDNAAVAATFMDASKGIDQKVASFIYNKLNDWK